MIARITRAAIRTYRDNGQTMAYVDWVDAKGCQGRTGGTYGGTHLAALLARAEGEGINIEREEW